MGWEEEDKDNRAPLLPNPLAPESTTIPEEEGCVVVTSLGDEMVPTLFGLVFNDTEGEEEDDEAEEVAIILFVGVIVNGGGGCCCCCRCVIVAVEVGVVVVVTAAAAGGVVVMVVVAMVDNGVP